MATKEKDVPVKQTSGADRGGASSVAAARGMSPLRAWEREVERMLDELPRLRWPFHREMEPFRFARDLRMQMPSVDMYEENGDVVVKAELPGMKKDEIEVTLSDSTITLKGEKKKEEKVEEKEYYRCEREFGSFLRTVELPSEVKAEGVKATFNDGILEVRLPKSEAAKKKEVRVAVK